ncbi:MAG: hypothetical protein R6X32_12090, partial [Chloroflexota bacterium]
RWSGASGPLGRPGSHRSDLFPPFARSLSGRAGAENGRSPLVFVVLYVLLLNSIHELTPADKKIFSRNSLSFGLMFAVLSAAHYFVQITAVRFNLSAGQFEGLVQVLQSNPHSAMSAINMLGVTLFFGLSSLFVAPVFTGRGVEKVIRISFLLNGIFLLLGAVGYLFQWLVLLFVTVNLGMGSAAFVGLVALAVWFRRRAVQ